jgi:hypothetical protein
MKAGFKVGLVTHRAIGGEKAYLMYYIRPTDFGGGNAANELKPSGRHTAPEALVIPLLSVNFGIAQGGT